MDYGNGDEKKKKEVQVQWVKKKGRRGPSEMNRSQGSARDDEPRQRARVYRVQMWQDLICR